MVLRSRARRDPVPQDTAPQDTAPQDTAPQETGPRRHGFARRAWTGWAAPLTAAAAVAVVILGSVAAGSWLTHPGSKPGNGGSSGVVGALGPGTRGSAGTSAVPPYYVALGNPSYATVKATATGATLAKIPNSTPFVGVTAAADDRTFVLDAQRQVMGSTVRWPGQPEFYLLRLSPSGTEKSLTRLTFPVLPGATAVTGLALSPDGRELAVAMDTGTGHKPGIEQIRIYTLATGAFRDWSALGLADSQDPDGFTGSGVDGSQTISWTADSRTLAFDWSNSSQTGVRLLDPTGGGGDLITDSRLAVIQSPPGNASVNAPYYVSRCVTDSIITPDGSSVVCGYTTSSGTGTQGNAYNTTTGFMRYSTKTGRGEVASVFQFRGQAPGDIALYWTNSTGNTLIAAILTPSGIRTGVIHGKTFTPLPGATGIADAAW